jgi:TrmH family RNA methyltransferase
LRLLTLARDLRRRKARERHRLFVAEGVRAVEELARSPLRIRGVLTAPQLADAPRGAALRADLEARGVELADVAEREFASAAETDSPQGVLAIAEAPERSLDTLDLGERSVLLILDAVQDPGNVGTILRTAAALGATATVTLPGTVDLWNAKVVRSAMGAHFHHPALSSTWDALDAFRVKHDIALWAADAAGAPIGDVAAEPPSRVALVLGNEGNGLSDEARARATAMVALPISREVESLNVAVAAGIFLYVLRR